MSGIDLIHTYSSEALAQGDIKILFCLHKFPHAVTEVRTCGTESPAIDGKAWYVFAQLANHKKFSPLSDHTRTVPTTTRLLGLVLKVNVCDTCRCGHPGSGIYVFYIFGYILYVCRVLTIYTHIFK